MDSDSRDTNNKCDFNFNTSIMDKDLKHEIVDIIKVTLIDEFKTNSEDHIYLKTKVDAIDKKLCGMNKNVNACKVDINEIIIDRTRQTAVLKDWRETRSLTCPKVPDIEVLKDKIEESTAIKKWVAKAIAVGGAIIGIIIMVIEFLIK